MTIQSVNPRTGEKFGTLIPETTPAELEAKIALSLESFQTWSTLPPALRAKSLHAIAEKLQANSTELADIADLETNLGKVRLIGEVSRTSFQLHQFAYALESGDFISPVIDSAVDAPLPQGHPELIRTQTPIGVVAVFGASNFPFAFSVLGGDTASALAAGCTVIVKSHPAHPQTSVRTYKLATEALLEVGAPMGTLGLINGVESGRMLLEDGRISAGAFTGSRQGGRALFDISNKRATPIPFYGELGSVNPVVVLASALDDPKGFVAGYLDSLLLGNGQFCTNPSLLFVPVDLSLENEIESQLADRVPSTFLSEATKMLHDKNREALRALITPKILAGQKIGEVGFYSSPTVFLSRISDLQGKESALSIECFGPTGLVLTYKTVFEVTDLISRMEGALVASVFGKVDDTQAPIVVRTLAKKVGRVAWNAWPTGVAVATGQQHGGPYPASTSPLHTSVGTWAITRFLRPITFQSLPSALFNLVATNIEKS
jgi:NADP-dependent aldehyde dehydrogenase